MQNLIIDNISLIVFLPLWIFLIIMCGRFVSVYVNKFIIYVLTLFSSALGLFFCVLGLFNIHDALEWSYPFLKIKDFVITFGLHADKISLIMGIILFSISFCVQLFSVSYMKNEKKNYRFYALLNLFNFSMSALVFSPNLFQLYVFWEIVGIASYLLIGFDYSSKIKSDASKRVFLINRFGDVAFISGIILTSYVMYNYGGNSNFTTLAFFDFNAISTLLYAYTSLPLFYFICGLFILSAMVKSAQFPFHIWLQEAMEAKLPVSALLHSATMVAAGVYLLVRMMPFFTLNSNLLIIIISVGVITSIVCSILASVEVHPKKALAYSTSANLGLMFFALGMENIRAALILFAAHAFIKSVLFLTLPDEEKVVSKIKYVFFIFGALNLAGLILTGFCAKEALYCSIVTNHIYARVFLLSAFLGAFYITRLCFLIKENAKFIKFGSKLENLGIFILIILNLLLYAFIRDEVSGIHSLFIAELLGAFLAICLNRFNLLAKIGKVPNITNGLFNKITPYVYEKCADFTNIIENRIFSNYKPIFSFAKMGVCIFNYIEENVMNKSVNVVKDVCYSISRTDKKLQRGNIQVYNGYAFMFITVIIALMITLLWCLIMTN